MNKKFLDYLYGKRAEILKAIEEWENQIEKDKQNPISLNYEELSQLHRDYSQQILKIHKDELIWLDNLINLYITNSKP